MSPRQSGSVKSEEASSRWCGIGQPRWRSPSRRSGLVAFGGLARSVAAARLCAGGALGSGQPGLLSVIVGSTSVPLTRVSCTDPRARLSAPMVSQRPPSIAREAPGKRPPTTVAPSPPAARPEVSHAAARSPRRAGAHAGARRPRARGHRTGCLEVPGASGQAVAGAGGRRLAAFERSRGRRGDDRRRVGIGRVRRALQRRLERASIWPGWRSST